MGHRYMVNASGKTWRLLPVTLKGQAVVLSVQAESGEIVAYLDGKEVWKSVVELPEAV